MFTSILSGMSNRKLIVLSLIFSIFIHLLVAFFVYELLKTQKITIPPPPKQYFVDIITLPQLKSRIKQTKKEKHLIAANVARKGMARIKSKKEKIPLGITNRPPGGMVYPATPARRKPASRPVPQKSTSKQFRVHKKTETGKSTGVKKPRQKGKKKPLQMAKKGTHRGKTIRKKPRTKPPILKVPGALYVPFAKKSNPGFPGGTTKHYEYRKAKREATVSIGTQSLKYASYMQHVKDQIEGVWEYPEEAQLKNQQGSLLLLFSIDKNGRLVALKLLRSSGFPLLDKAAMDAVREAAPFPPLPKRLKLDRLNVYATFSYRLYAWYIQ